MPLPEHVFVVDAAVDPSFEAAWNEWYNDVHLPEITACPGIRQSARYVCAQDGARHYIAIYEVDGPETLRSAEFNQRRGWREFAGHVKWTSRLSTWSWMRMACRSVSS
jgi:antibiotic biosynthesis monooxygenase (ABM) superfamily enzyme